ncbi:MAG: hypothetical protein IPN58_13705 [Anaerolineales bacterium]|nr:hypothetical protein [Anaerolineales bacterium]
MKKNTRLNLTFSLILFLLASCAPKTVTADPATLINQAVIATLAAMPTTAPASPPTPYPSPTPFSLAGLYCEYQFCIGHPTGMAFYDHHASLDQLNPSNYNNGFLIAYQLPDLLINFIWLQSPDTADPKFLLDTMLDDQLDTMTGSMDIKLVRGMNVIYTPIATSVSPILPFGGVGAWTCGDRVFAWKAYTPLAETASPLFEEALSRFTCGQN